MLNFSAIALAAAVFASTNVDDLLVVSAFFAQPNAAWRTVAGGQFIGIGALVTASGLVALAALSVPSTQFSYLGSIPLILGVRRLLSRRRRSMAGAPPPRRQTGPSLLTVTTVTVASGGDNLSVYVPLFAKAPPQIPLYAATFAVLTSLWCILGYWLANHALVGTYLRRVGHLALPLVMIGIGIWLLKDLAR